MTQLTKLTLSMDEAAIRKGKEYARDTGRSLSGILEDYLNRLADDRRGGLSNSVSALIGIGRGDADEDSYRAHLEGKHAR